MREVRVVLAQCSASMDPFRYVPISTVKTYACSTITRISKRVMTIAISAESGKKITETLNEVYIRRVQNRVEGNGLQRTTIDFEYSFETEQ